MIIIIDVVGTIDFTACQDSGTIQGCMGSVTVVTLPCTSIINVNFIAMYIK